MAQLVEDGVCGSEFRSPSFGSFVGLHWQKLACFLGGDAGEHRLQVALHVVEPGEYSRTGLAQHGHEHSATRVQRDRDARVDVADASICLGEEWLDGFGLLPELYVPLFRCVCEVHP